MAITTLYRFKNEYLFLDPYSESSLSHEGRCYPSVMQALLANKTLCCPLKDYLASEYLGKEKLIRLNLDISKRPNWDREMKKVMREILKSRYSQATAKKLLVSTHPLTLVYGNYDKDVLWGVDLVEKKGNNLLGTMLMALRETLLKEEI